MRKTFPFDQFHTETHQAWKRDRLRRQRVPLHEGWRGCVGLAMLWNDVDDADWHGDRIFYSNNNLIWACLRDVPVGHFPRSRSLNRRNVLYGSITTAVLRHGMPCLDFSLPTRLAWDLASMPYGTVTVRTQGQRRAQMASGDVLNSDERPREFAVFTQMSTRMTDFAVTAHDRGGRPARPAWARLLRRPGRSASTDVTGHYFPMPYLGFRITEAERLYHAATNRGFVVAAAYPCASCGGLVEPVRIRPVMTFGEDGDVVAPCPLCRQTVIWHTDDALPGRAGRCFSPSFRDGFCTAVTQGLPLRASERWVYMGVQAAPDESGHGPDLLGHRLMAQDGQEMVTYLPRSACILVRPGGIIQTGMTWCQTVPAPDQLWRSKDVRSQWVDLAGVCGSTKAVGFLQQLWFNAQAVRLPRYPHLVFFPAGLVATAVQEIPPQQLVWETDVTGPLIDPETESVVFPPVRTRQWNQLHLNVCDVAINAEIGDPRFSRERTKIVNASQSVARLLA